MKDKYGNLSRDELVTALKQSTDSQQKLEKLLEQSQTSNQQLMDVIHSLKEQVEKLQRMLFGQSSERQPKSKKKSGEEDSTKKPGKPGSKDGNKKSNGNGRRTLPKDLTRKVVKHDFEESDKKCQHCEGKLQCIGKEVSEQLEFIPAQLYVIEHRRYKYACRCCQSIMTAPMPEQPIDKGLAGPGLLAETLINKYQEHLPLYRLEKRYERLGYHIPRSTLCDWVMACGERLAPIVDSMCEDMLLMSPKIHSDDTVIPVFASGKTHNGRLWVYIGGGGHAPPCSIYKYTKTRSGKAPQKLLANYRGFLQADAYAGYDKCFESGDIIEVGCLAHARRKFVDALKTTTEDVVAQSAIDHIAVLYGVEKQAKSMTNEARYYYRKRFAKPQLKRFYKWLVTYGESSPPKSPIGKAINYCLNHWQALQNYLRDGVLDIDNNRAERAMRSVVLGRKNYLFAGSHEGAEKGAVIYSLIETCKLLKINPSEYLTDVFKRLPTTLNAEVKSLIPYNWKPVAG